jgi:hypothetical protein
MIEQRKRKQLQVVVVGVVMSDAFFEQGFDYLQIVDGSNSTY